MTKELETALKRLMDMTDTDRRIHEITGEPGEWFVYLKPGFAFRDANTDAAQHGFGEDTKAAIRKSMKAVRPCRCAECVRLLATNSSGGRTQ